MKVAITVLFCLCLYSTRAASADIVSDVVMNGTRVAAQGNTILTRHSSEMNVKVVFTTSIVNIGKPSDAPPKQRIAPCTYSRFPCSPVDSLSISVDGNSIDVPRDVYRDMADVTAAEINIKDKSAVITVVGGDASATYIEVIKFDNHHVNEITWASGLAPHFSLKETILHYLPDNYFDH